MRLIALGVPVLLAAGFQEPDDDSHRTGRFKAVFKERHPSGSLKEIARRFGWSMDLIRKEDPGAEARKIEDESFQIRVHASYAKEKPAGLLVWIATADSGGEVPGWADVLEKRNLILIGPNKAGNDRLVWDRARLALDAVHNMGKRYALDPHRIYVCGYSGGARTASRLGLCYADVFRGGMYMGGMDFYKAIPNPAKPKEVWPAVFPKPAGELLRKTRKESRHVAMAGTDDFNLPPSKAMAEEMQKREEFAHATFMEMTGKGHEWADAEWLEKALEFLDTPPAPPKK